jgi:hypothetical protein
MLVMSLGTETPPPTRYTPGEKNTAMAVVYVVAVDRDW